MKIIVGVRALNEAELFPVFLSNIPFADVLVVADGGSTDRTKAIALTDPRVIWHDFTDRVPGKNGGWRNPEGAHVRFLLDRMEELCHEPEDWLWMTEVDAFPNLNLQREARTLLERCNVDGVPLFMTWLCYVAPDGVSHYPRTMQGPGYTAWHRGAATVDAGADFDGQGNLYVEQRNAFSADQTLSRIHLTWETEELIARKIAWYREVHSWDHLKHPDVDWAPRKPLPDWAVWNDPRNEKGMSGYGHERTWTAEHTD